MLTAGTVHDYKSWQDTPKRKRFNHQDEAQMGEEVKHFRTFSLEQVRNMFGIRQPQGTGAHAVAYQQKTLARQLSTVSAKLAGARNVTQ